ncbi:MAG: 50S ribosomal protein L10 [Clostridiales bacterium]|nr:50S ribosomal protein L10 [Clostridiales bacterium]MBQ2817631.1 50S ribosomal protein L10 [Clostridia bacterium]MBQ4637420.1 50S ribosomal protein L10 [Clostridia bacterium]
MNKNHEAKAVVVEQIKEKLSNAKSCVLVDYRGLTVEEDTALRRSLREAGVEYKVLKNTLIKRAANALDLTDLDPFLNGPTAVAFSETDPVAPAKIIAQAIEKTKKMEIKAGYVEGKFCDAATLGNIAKLPSKEVLIAKMLGSFNAPLCNFLYCINAIIEKREAEQA